MAELTSEQHAFVETAQEWIGRAQGYIEMGDLIRAEAALWLAERWVWRAARL